jgi:hypothetical protein
MIEWKNITTICHCLMAIKSDIIYPYLGFGTKFAKTRETCKGRGCNIPLFTFKCVKSAREEDQHFQVHSHFWSSKLVRSCGVF